MNLEARRVIEQVRSARTPSADDKERIRKALAIGVVAAVASVPATATGATVAVGKMAGAVGIASGLKIAVSVAVVASLGVGTYWLTRSTPVQRPVVATVASAPAAVAAPPVAAEPAPPPTVEPPPIVADAAPASPGRPGRDPLMAELSLLHKAQQAWRQGNAARALALAQQHARQYPHSVLAMERDALRVFALCALGQKAQARPLASAILKRAPGSPLRTAVEESCGGR